MARVFSGERTFLSPVLAPVERGFYAAAGVDPKTRAGLARLCACPCSPSSLAGFAALYAILRLQVFLPLNPQGFAGVAPDLAFNTAVSFVTNTNWQAYGGETTMSHFSQMAGLTVQNFLSAASRHRACARRDARLRALGASQTRRQFLGRSDPRHALRAAAARRSSWRSPSSRWACRRRSTRRSTATTLEGAQQTIALGPVASQEAIKQLGTNGGGFFNVNAAHPFENPTALSNYLNIVAMLVDLGGAGLRLRPDGRRPPPGLGVPRRDRRSCWSSASASIYWAETAGNPVLTALGVDPALGNMEGKEVRFGLAMTAPMRRSPPASRMAASTPCTAPSPPLGGLVPMFLIQLGEVLPGGVGSGLYGMVVFAMLAVFVAGLMVGRTPEFLGKKIEAREMKFAMLAVLILPLAILGFTAVSAMLPVAVASVGTAGPHGLSEILYAYHLGGGQQRLGLRRPDGQHALVQHHARHRHAARPLRLCRAGAGDRRLARRQDARRRRPPAPSRPTGRSSSAC